MTDENAFRERPSDPRVAIDAALRGEAPMTAELREKIRNLDAALAGHPMPDDVIMYLASDLAFSGVEPEAMADATFVEPTYTRAFPVSFEDPAARAIIHLRVPAGTPAIFLPAANKGAGARPEFLLGRGLGFAVSRVFRDENGQWQVFARGVIPAVAP